MVDLPTRADVVSEIRERAEELDLDLEESDIHVIRKADEITVEIDRERLEALGRVSKDTDDILGAFQAKLRDVYDRDIEVAFGVNISERD